MSSPSLRRLSLALSSLVLLLLSSSLSAQTFSFCHVVTTNGVLSYSTWSSVMVGTFTATLVSGTSNQYNVTGVSGYRNVSSSALTGAVASSTRLTSIALGAAALGGADSSLTFPTEALYTTSSGITVIASAQQTDIGGCVGTNQYNIYSDTQLVCGVNGQSITSSSYASFTVVQGSTPPTCSVPAQTTIPGLSPTGAFQSFYLCYTTYSSLVAPGVSYWASVTSALINASLSTTAGVYIASSITGSRIVSDSAGNGTIASAAQLALEAAGNCFGGCDNLLLYSTGATAATDLNGLALRLSANQTDVTGCSGQDITLHGASSTCNNGVAATSPLNTLVLSTTAVSCPQPTTPALYPPTSCSVGSYSLQSLAAADLFYSDCVSGQTIYMRLCAPVNNSACAGVLGANAMVCQQLTAQHVWSAAAYRANSSAGALTFSFTNGVDVSQGVSFATASGGTCGDAANRRTVVGTITCGCQNALVGWTETAPCQYTAQLTSPAVCSGNQPACTPATTYQFGMCWTTGTAASFTSSTWASQVSAVLTATAACGSYQVQSISGYRVTARTDGSGTVSSNSSISGLDYTLGQPDNLLLYPGSPYYTDTSGLAFRTAQTQSDAVCGGSNTFNVYGANQFICGLNGNGDGATQNAGQMALTVAQLSNASAAFTCSPPTSSGSGSSPSHAAAGWLIVAFSAVLAALLMA